MNNGDIFFIKPTFHSEQYAILFIEDKEMTDTVMVENSAQQTFFITRNNISSFIVVNKDEFYKIINN